MVVAALNYYLKDRFSNGIHDITLGNLENTNYDTLSFAY